MKLSDLEHKLIAGARKAPATDNVPYAFEKRIMVHVSALTPVNVWGLWGKPLWRAAFSCLAITALCGIWSFVPLHGNETDSFSQDLESAVYAAVNQHAEDAW